MPVPPQLPTLARSLSARLLALTLVLVLVGQVLIYVPSIARFRLAYLEERIAAAHVATLSLDASPTGRVSIELQDELTRHAGVLSVTLRRPEGTLILGELPPVDAVFDLHEAGFPDLIGDAFGTLWHQGARTIRVIGASPHEVETLVDVSLPEGPLWLGMVDYSWRILYLSVVLSVLVAVAVYACLQLMIVRPLRRITEAVTRFRDQPEDARADLPDSGRRDEIGIVQGELRRMQQGLRTALAQKTRLAALGAAVSKINHDLRNLLSTAILLSDRLDLSRDPEVRRIAPRLLEAIERAAKLCSETLTFARTQALPPRATRFRLAELVDEVGLALLVAGDGGLRFENRVPRRLEVEADRDQLFRVLLNLGRNSQEALGEAEGTLMVGAQPDGRQVVVEVADTGPGIPEKAQAQLFEAFAASGRPGGTGLGLSIAREIMRAHGGEVRLERTGPEGTLFRLELPSRSQRRRRRAA